MYIASRPDLAITADVMARFRSEDALAARNITMSEACKILNVSPGTMRRLAESHDLFLVKPLGSGIPSLLSAEKVRQLQEMLRDGLLIEESRRIIGVGRPVLDQIEKAGLLTRMSGERSMTSHAFRRSDVEALVEACRGAAPVLSKDEASSSPLVTIVGMVCPGRSYSDICRALIEGRLQARGVVTGMPGLTGVRLRADEVRRTLKVGSGDMSAVEVGQLLGVKHQAVRIWVRKGYLPSFPQSSGTGSLRILVSEIERFQQSYMLGGEIADLAGTPGCGTFVRHLTAHGVNPISGPSIDGCSATLYRRIDVMPEILVAINQRRTDGNDSIRTQRARCSAQLSVAIRIIAGQLGSDLKRTNNRLDDPSTGRITQFISGSRYSISGTFRFKLNSTSLQRLQTAKVPYVALVPDQGQEFIHAPLEEVLSHTTPEQKVVGIRFDQHGRALDLTKWAIPLNQADAG